MKNNIKTICDNYRRLDFLFGQDSSFIIAFVSLFFFLYLHSRVRASSTSHACCDWTIVRWTSATLGTLLIFTASLFTASLFTTTLFATSFATSFATLSSARKMIVIVRTVGTIV